MKIPSFLIAGLLVAGASAQHDGDLIYGGVNGKIKVVDPTYMPQLPRNYSMTFFPASGTTPAFWVADVGFDYFDFPGFGIDTITDARVTPVSMSRGLRAADNLNTYFSAGATRPTFRLVNTQRHKHFTFFIYDRDFRGQRLSFKFRFTNAFVGTTAQQNSDVHTINFEPSRVPRLPWTPPFRR